MTKKEAITYGYRVLKTLIFRTLYIVFFGSITAASHADSIRLGWQTPWATQGQLVMGLKHTNIPELANVAIDLIGFTYGGPLNQSALAGKVDVLLTADQPAIALLSRTDNFKVVSRMMYNRTCLYVPAVSPVETLEDLAGGYIAGPVGAAAERTALRVLREAGLDLASMKFGNIDMGRQATLVAVGGGDGRWGEFDALYGFDPLPAVFESRGLAKMIHCGRVISVVVASRDMLENRREELERFLLAFYLSWYQYAKEPEKMNQLFLTDSNLEFTAEALEIAAFIEPNRQANELAEIRLRFTPEDFEIFDEASSFLVSKGIIDAPIDMRQPQYLDTGPLEAMLARKGTASLAESIKPVDQ